MARRTKGLRRTRRLLKAIDPVARLEITDIIAVATVKLRNLAKLRAPVRTQKLSAGITSKVLERSLKGRVGLLTKSAQGRLFYGHILNRGRKGGTVKAVRSRNGVRQSYTVRVRSIAAKYFLPGNIEAASIIGPRLRQAWEQILADASQGIGLD